MRSAVAATASRTLPTRSGLAGAREKVPQRGNYFIDDETWKLLPPPPRLAKRAAFRLNYVLVFSQDGGRQMVNTGPSRCILLASMFLIEWCDARWESSTIFRN